MEPDARPERRRHVSVSAAPTRRRRRREPRLPPSDLYAAGPRLRVVSSAERCGSKPTRRAAPRPCCHSERRINGVSQRAAESSPPRLRSVFLSHQEVGAGRAGRAVSPPFFCWKVMYELAGSRRRVEGPPDSEVTVAATIHRGSPPPSSSPFCHRSTSPTCAKD